MVLESIYESVSWPKIQIEIFKMIIAAISASQSKDGEDWQIGNALAMYSLKFLSSWLHLLSTSEQAHYVGLLFENLRLALSNHQESSNFFLDADKIAWLDVQLISASTNPERELKCPSRQFIQEYRLNAKEELGVSVAQEQVYTTFCRNPIISTDRLSINLAVHNHLAVRIAFNYAALELIDEDETTTYIPLSCSAQFIYAETCNNVILSFRIRHVIFCIIADVYCGSG